MLYYIRYVYIYIYIDMYIYICVCTFYIISYIIFIYTTLYYIVLHYIILYYIIIVFFIIYVYIYKHYILYDIWFLLYYTISYHIIHCIVLYCIILYYIILCYIILYYIIYVYVYGSDPTRRYWPQVWHRSLEALQIGGLFTLKNWVSGLMFVDLDKLLGNLPQWHTSVWEAWKKTTVVSDCNKRKGLIISTHPTVLERIKKKHIQFRIIIPAMEILKSLETTKC